LVSTLLKHFKHVLSSRSFSLPSLSLKKHILWCFTAEGPAKTSNYLVPLGSPFWNGFRRPVFMEDLFVIKDLSRGPDIVEIGPITHIPTTRV
jgi:hypothetical protein